METIRFAYGACSRSTGRHLPTRPADEAGQPATIPTTADHGNTIWYINVHAHSKYVYDVDVLGVDYQRVVYAYAYQFSAPRQKLQCSTGTRYDATLLKHSERFTIRTCD
jgi:hypothetical protein